MPVSVPVLTICPALYNTFTAPKSAVVAPFAGDPDRMAAVAHHPQVRAAVHHGHRSG
jgi:hypothetical protein